MYLRGSTYKYLISRLYHSKNGVYGYTPRKVNNFQVSEQKLISRIKQCNVYRWIEAYRTHAHRIANINPVAIEEVDERFLPELDYRRYGLTPEHNLNSLDELITTQAPCRSLKDLESFLRKMYCGSIGVEFSHLENEEERDWLIDKYEYLSTQKLSRSTKLKTAEVLLKSQVWDKFLAAKFPSGKRFGGEGAESLLAFCWQLLESSVENNIENLILGVGHRGKFNLTTILFNVHPSRAFLKLSGKSELPINANGMGDTPLCLYVSEDLIINGKKIHISVPSNPAHLESVNPVSMGKTRSKLQILCDGPYDANEDNPSSYRAVNIQIHGDAAFSGQGVNQESLMMAGVPHFNIGGTVHLIVNNQLGFTTPGDRCRGTRYCSDLAKSIGAPIIHVNGNDPEAVIQMTRLAFDYRRKFGKDVLIDMNCFRKWGHNELDDPTFSNPVLYQRINSIKSVPDTYAEKLISQGITTKDALDEISVEYKEHLNDELNKLDSYIVEPFYFKNQWTGIQFADNCVTTWDTGFNINTLKFIGTQSVNFPNDFTIHPHLLKTHVKSRLKRLDEEQNIDWSTAEALAIGSLMYEGYYVRLCGQDSGRGTFSQRHAMLIDQKTNEMYIPLNSLPETFSGKLELVSSILSEEGVLGFEYGMSIDNPKNLIIWEAQFGDFFNGAQAIYDEYISSGESKWMFSSGLVMLLPHGYDGGGANHSSCRIERFLQSTNSKENRPDGDDINVQVVNLSTSAQYFHVLRRQMVRNYRKPLVIVAPKTLLRRSEATSNLSDFGPGKTFLSVIGDDVVDPDQVKKVILCSGKHYYDLNEERLRRGCHDVAIVRVESLCPFPVGEINNELEKYKVAKSFIWSQEEHRNMGAWSFIKTRFENMCGHKINYNGRKVAGAPAVGISALHQEEASSILKEAFV